VHHDPPRFLDILALLLATSLSLAVARAALAAEWVVTSTPGGGDARGPLVVLPDGTVLLMDFAVTRYRPDTGLWVQEALPERIPDTATLLPGGLVLTTRGIAQGPSPLADLYDPATRVTRSTALPNVARKGYVATRLSSGQVLIAGGRAGNGEDYIAVTETYDPSAETWTSAGSLNEPRIEHQVVALDDGRALVAGGREVHVGFAILRSSAELYEPASRTWRLVSPPPIELERLLRLPDGRVLGAGPANSSAHRAIAATVYDAGTDTWSPPVAVRVSGPARIALLRMTLDSPAFQAVLPDPRDPVALAALMTRVYRVTLGREPDQFGLKGWIDNILSTGRLADAIAFFLTSGWVERRPMTFRQFASELVLMLYGRDGTVDEIDAAEGFLRARLAEIIDNGFLPSADFQARLAATCAGR
jgi:hypothetical protein